MILIWNDLESRIRIRTTSFRIHNTVSYKANADYDRYEKFIQIQITAVESLRYAVSFFIHFSFEQDMDGYQLSVVSTMFQHPDWKCFEVGIYQYTVLFLS
jgi:hypothetical protein